MTARSKWMLLQALLLGLMLAMVGCQTAEQSQTTEQSQPTAQALTGQIAGRLVADYYLDTCSGCHGADRRGATGPALLAERMSQDDSYYFDIIKKGKPGTVMPPWGGSLSDAEINEMVAYLRGDSDAASLKWSLEDTRVCLEILIPEEELPAEPTHQANLDNLMLVTEREGRAIAVLDGDTHTLLGKIPASYRAHGYTFSPVEPRWAYNMGRDGWVFKIDLYTLQPVRKIRIGLDFRSVAISDDGRFLIVANYVPATALILDADTLEPLKFIETKATNPEGEMIESRVATILDTAPELVGPYFLVALKEAGQVWRIDWSQPDFPMETLENVGHILHDGFLSPDNRTFYLASQQDDWMAAVDVENMQIIEKIQTGDIPHPGSGAAWKWEGVSYGATVHAGEGLITIWDMDTNQIVTSLETPGACLFIRTHELTPYVWADSVFAKAPHAIVIFEKQPPFKIVKIIDEGLRTLHPEFTMDGKFVYVADWDGDVVRVYDAVTLEKVAEISGIHTPTGIFNAFRRYETLGY